MILPWLIRRAMRPTNGRRANRVAPGRRVAALATAAVVLALAVVAEPTTGSPSAATSTGDGGGAAPAAASVVPDVTLVLGGASIDDPQALADRLGSVPMIILPTPSP